MLSSRAVVWLFAIALAIAVFAVGPALSGEDAAPVKGAITVKGQPLASGRIFFHLDNDQFVGAKINDGMFIVNRVPAGRHKVSIEGKGVGVKYTSENTTPVLVEVTSDAPAGAYDIRLD